MTMIRQDDKKIKEENFDLDDFNNRMLCLLNKRIEQDLEFRKKIGCRDITTTYPIPNEPLSIDDFNKKILSIMMKQRI